MPHRDVRPRVAVGRNTVCDRSWIEAHRVRPVLVVGGLLAALLFLLSSLLVANAAVAAVCDKYAATNGSDGARGTSSSPYRTAQKLVDSLSPGQTGCLRGGTYNEGTNLTIKKDRITLSAAPNQRVRIKSRVYVRQGADGVTVRDLSLEGTPGKVNVLIRGNYSRWIGNEITNYNSDKVCVLVGSRYVVATGTDILRNSIYGCGSHGIYASNGKGTEIIGNRIYDNVGRGVQLYPNAQGTLIRGNKIDGNGWGVVFSGYGGSASSNNLVEDNTITNSRRGWNIYGVWGSASQVGKGNVARYNCVWASSRNSWFNKNGGIKSPQEGFRAYSNRVSSQCT